MRFSGVTLIAAATLGLAACGSEASGDFTTEDGEDGEYSVDYETGETNVTLDTPDGEVSMRSGSDVPIDLPAGFALMPGATVVSNTVVDQADGRGALVTFTTDKGAEEIAAFYRKQAESTGIAIHIETTMNGGKMLGGENEATGTTFSITAYPTGEDGLTMGQLTIGEERR